MTLDSSTHKPWVVFRVLKIQYCQPVGRFRSRVDADCYLKVARKLQPGCYTTVWQPPQPPKSES
ncbi:hypothetical protein [Iningainema tapete]|uniref:SPOR domain-containing protein n=1 Tax=Iningainema tapete BLCC-T55 TaxID=2748662 RepID=A0A8J6XY57_9CYAN|nr:hypothetical protein [Iningainema tapete]MBD2775183.1 hypothetical protein [Iningainema tapete BLCC-T55]